ncbi:MAG: DUF3995 domain-containing protein, partial [Alphaproteobacteria bacterium]|nr:DUF3995 domain-containing protein [Alphaproteobacteria bacterium]
MITLIGVLIALLLLPVATLHFLWASGSHWPAKSEAALVRAAVGAADQNEMPPVGVTLVVAVGIAGAGLCALWGVGLIGLPLAEWMRPASQIVLGVIFTV